jgi:hypothetical protein
MECGDKKYIHNFGGRTSSKDPILMRGLNMWLGWKDKKCTQHFHRKLCWKVFTLKTEEAMEDNIKMDPVEVNHEDWRWIGLAQIDF